MRTALTLSLFAAGLAFALVTLSRWAGAHTEHALAGLQIPLPAVL